MQVYFHWVVRDSQLTYFRDTLETIAQDDVRAWSRCLLIATITCLLLPDVCNLHWRQSGMATGSTTVMSAVVLAPSLASKRRFSAGQQRDDACDFQLNPFACLLHDGHCS